MFESWPFLLYLLPLILFAAYGRMPQRNRHSHVPVTLPALGLILVGLGDCGSFGADRISFSDQIRPLISDRCFACHGPDENHREADLRLDDFPSLQRDRGNYQVLVPGDPDASELLTRIEATDPDVQMPPPSFGKPLSTEEQALFRQWIEQGADWEEHWAYVTPKPTSSPSHPTIKTNNWIDNYVASQHVAVGGHFADAADPVSLARRLSFDLTGLPPEPDQIARLPQTWTQPAIAAYVDRLLASPAFGERMASYWLDLVRYADTVGYHGDQDHNISPYRDYVIDAFNDNKPFSAFTIEQLAGDLLENPSTEQIVATGYNRLLQTSHEGGVQPKEYLAIYQADRVRNLSAVWFGATIGCAQCHDHKYDPYTMRDFYSLAAFFADIDEAQHFKVGSNSLPTKRPPEMDVLSRSEILRPPEQRQPRRTMITQAITPREVKLLPRGDWLDDSGPTVQPAVPTFLGQVRDGTERANRLDLARWLVDEQAGVGLLTARIMVNRLWFLLFGDGLSKSVDDFGGQGRPPSHPQLLDQLAIEFVRSGWDIKHMVRLIVGSRTYQQSSLASDWQRQHDASNRWLTRQNRFRLPAESIRDNVLQVSGLLVAQTGGTSVKPYQPAGYYRHLNFPTRRYQASAGRDQYRRGVYAHWQRQFLHPMLAAFDAPMREECTGQRPRSNTPLAALVLLNDPSFTEAANAFAMRTVKPNSTDRDNLANLFRAATSRMPDTFESAVLLKLLSSARAASPTADSPDQPATAVGEKIHTELATAELAAWSSVSRAILNLGEVYTRE